MTDETKPQEQPQQPVVETVTQQLKRRFRDMMMKDIQFMNANKENNE